MYLPRVGDGLVCEVKWGMGYWVFGGNGDGDGGVEPGVLGYYILYDCILERMGIINEGGRVD
jgi:hypothetical protein